MAKKKFYVVWHGQEPGIYDNWQDCQLQIKGFPGAKYASFKTHEEAQEAYDHGYEDYRSKAGSKKKPASGRQNWGKEVDQSAWAVDAACSGNPGAMEYRGVAIADSAEIFHMGPFRVGTNNIGEFLAIVHALALLYNAGDGEKKIYTDSRTALSWVRNKKVKTKLPRKPTTAQLFELITRAENWLKQHDHTNPLVKWETEEWGEIPADFGRK